MTFLKHGVNLSIQLLIPLAGFFFSCGSKQEILTEIQFRPYSTAIVEIRMIADPLDTIQVRVINTTVIPRSENFSKRLPIVASGKYYLTIQSDRPSDARLIVNDSLFHVLIVPEDTTLITLSPDAFTLTFAGKYKPVNEYLLLRDREKGFNISSVDDKQSYTKVFEDVDSITGVKNDFLDKYTLETKLPEWFVQYEKAENEYSAAYFKIHFPTTDKDFKDVISSPQYKFLSGVKINNDEAILSGWYYFFLDEYFIRTFDYRIFDDLAGFKRAVTVYNRIQVESKKVLSGKSRSNYNQYMFGVIAPMTIDSLKIDSLARQYEISDLHVFKGLFESKEGVRYLQKNEKVEEFFVVDMSGRQVSIRDFSNKLVYINFWATWCGPCLENIPALNKMIEEYANDDRIVFLNVCKKSEQDLWRNVISKTNIRGVNLFLEEGDVSEKITSIFKMTGVPTYVLLNTENRLLENNTDKAPAVKLRIDKLLNKSINERKNW